MTGFSLLETIELHLPSGYTIRGKLGDGATSSVYLACGADPDERLAVKVMLLGSVTDESINRFLREMQVLEKLEHPRIPRILDPGEASGSLFFTMPYIDGETLRAKLRRSGRLPVREALTIVRDIGGALDHAHGRGVVHRDVKPENIFIAQEGAYLIDFGLAITSDAESAGKADSISGTPEYMSPEQASRDRMEGWRSDFFSLGCVFYEMLAGKTPFHGGSARETMKRRQTAPPPDVRDVRPDVPEEVSVIIKRTLNTDPSMRFPTAGYLRRALDTALELVDAIGLVEKPVATVGHDPDAS
jgi:eukaryotic-like serine/threonine-protein kinase